jgi:FtsZ-binding cell division protein ZapB
MASPALAPASPSLTHASSSDGGHDNSAAFEQFFNMDAAASSSDAPWSDIYRYVAVRLSPACHVAPSHRLVSFRYYYNEKPDTQESANTQPLTALELENFQSLMSPAGFSADNSILSHLQPPSPRTGSDGSSRAKSSSNSFLAIDPSLVQQGTSPAPPESVVSEDFDMSLDPEEQADDNEEASGATSEKADRRKSATPGATTRKSGTGKLPHLKFDVPEYADKPSADEYKKLSSSSLMFPFSGLPSLLTLFSQVRRSVSSATRLAREISVTGERVISFFYRYIIPELDEFAHSMNAEYITQLEEEVAQRDSTISVLREEMDGLKLENQELRNDIKVLKGQWDSLVANLSSGTAQCASEALSPVIKAEETEANAIAASTPPLSSASSNSSPEADDRNHDDQLSSARPSTASSSSSSLSSQSSRRSSTRQTGSLAPPNVYKDLFGRKNASAWGPGGLSGISQNLGVHATWVPEVRLGSVGLDGKPVGSPFDDAPTLASFGSGKNLNPKLDALTDKQKIALAQATAHLRRPTSASDVQAGFFGANPYALKHSAIEDYRSVLYAKLGHNVTGALHAKHDPNNSFPVGFRPAFFSSPSESNSSLLSGKAPRDDSTVPSSATALDEHDERQKASYVAGLATSTVFSRLATSFLDAFAGNRPSGSPAASQLRNLSADKVADVLAGKAELRVVPVNNNSLDPVDSLGQNLGSLDLKGDDDVSSAASQRSFSEMVERALRKEQ